MITIPKLQLTIAWLLNIGMLLSLSLVLAGGIILLYQHGHQPIDLLIQQASQVTINPFNTWHGALTLSPISLIELGLLALVGTQVLRMVLLTIFYVITNDIWFTLFSLFILIALGYSFFMR